MKTVIDKILSLDSWILILNAVVIVYLLFMLVIHFYRTHRFKKHVDKLIKHPELKDKILSSISKKMIGRRTRSICRLSRKKGVNLPQILSAAPLWIEKFNKTKSKRMMKHLLEFIPDETVFYCFIRTLEKKQLMPILEKWLNSCEDFLVMRRIALSGKGEDFNGEEAIKMFSDRLDEIREMTGDPEWASRYFAIKILIYDQDERSMRSVWDSFNDAHSLVRKTVASEIDIHAHPYSPQTILNDEDKENKHALFMELYTLLLNDTVYEVRETAKRRILKEFNEFYKLDIKKMLDHQIIHIVELLDISSEDDKDIAIRLLGESNEELRLVSARFLSGSGDLNRLFNECYLNDKEQLERNYKLLRNACKVSISDFLYTLKRADNAGTLLTGSRLLLEFGGRDEINILAKKVFRFPNELKLDPDYKEIYSNTLDAVNKYGNDTSFDLLRQELHSIREHEDLLLPALNGIPNHADVIILPTLLDFFKDPGFLLPEQLREVLVRMPEAKIIPALLDILKKGRNLYDHSIRRQAVKLLGEMQKDYCLQTILENLTILPLDEAREFAGMLSNFAKNSFDLRTSTILASTDAHVRAALIASLPGTGKQTFIKEIRAALKDADPEVRIASIWALLEYQDTKQLNRSSEMLRDPVERVRVEVARALGQYGSEATMKELSAIINDKNEVDVVKQAALNGLSFSEKSKAVDILVDKLADDDDLKMETIQALSKKTDRNSIAEIIEHLKDAGPILRENISKTFELMGPDGEESVVNLLKEEIPSLRSYIAQALESTGFVEKTIRCLKHRDPKMRKDAADLLAKMGTQSAFRGIVLAARDPDENVRISVTRALEALNTEEGISILNALEHDPDKKVRKYTLWALERIQAKAI